MILRRTFLGGAVAAGGLALLPGAAASRIRSVWSKMYTPPFLSSEPMLWDVKLQADHDRNIFRIYIQDEKELLAEVMIDLEPIKQVMEPWSLPMPADVDVSGPGYSHPQRIKVAFQKNSRGPYGGDFALWPRVVGEGQWTAWLVTRDIAKTLAV